MFDWDGIYVTDREAQIDVRALPFDFYVPERKGFSKQIITYHVPFTGEKDLLKFKPSTRILWTTEISVANDSISFDIINWRDDIEQITKESDEIISKIKSLHTNLSEEVDRFNENLPEEVKSAVEFRKQEHLKQLNVLDSLGVPVKKSSNAPSTFAVPTLKKKVLVKPSAPDVAYKPEPTLDASLFGDILKICHDTGVEMERHPSIYSDKDEETLRDHFIMVLSPHFDSVTGETFNKVGKTDILIRHESANVFVAECKFWNGKKGLLSTIDQALSYLTWRDSKVAILQFIRNKELDPVLLQIEPTAESHPCHVKTNPQSGEGVYNFSFHLLGDATRGVELAILCFHFPQS